jgi:hypothetical protein
MNAISCLPISSGGKLDPKRAQDLALLDSCAQARLYPTIERLGPRILVPMGVFACKVICPEIDLELQHGIPTMTEWGIPAFPMYHPAGGLHEPKKMLLIRNDWIRLRRYLRGVLPIQEDEYPNPVYREVLTPGQIRLHQGLPLAGDTEIDRHRSPYCFTYSQEPGTGWLIRAERADLLREFQRQLTGWKSVILFHNWLFDKPVTAKMGLRFPKTRIVDTLARVYHLGNLPQGLKSLGKRELGVTMMDFVDLVKPYSIPRVLDYYRKAQSFDWPKPPTQRVLDEKTGEWKDYKPQSMSTKLKRFFTDYGKNPEKDVFQMWEKNWVDQQLDIEARCGEFPGMDIRYAPFDQILTYACRDADVLLRFWPRLQEMRRRVRKGPQETWAGND